MYFASTCELQLHALVDAHAGALAHALVRIAQRHALAADLTPQRHGTQVGGDLLQAEADAVRRVGQSTVLSRLLHEPYRGMVVGECCSADFMYLLLQLALQPCRLFAGLHDTTAQMRPDADAGDPRLAQPRLRCVAFATHLL